MLMNLKQQVNFFSRIRFEISEIQTQVKVYHFNFVEGVKITFHYSETTFFRLVLVRN